MQLRRFYTLCGSYQGAAAATGTESQDDDDAYRAALPEANVEVVAAVDNLAPRNFTTGAAPRRLMRELRSLGSDLPQPSCAIDHFTEIRQRKTSLHAGVNYGTAQHALRPRLLRV